MIIQKFCVKRKWIVMTITLGLMTLATSAYLMYREIYRPKRPNDILVMYGKLFRDQNELDELNLFIRRGTSHTVNETSLNKTDTCNLTCPEKQPNQADFLTDYDIASNTTTGNDTRDGSDTYVVRGTVGEDEPLIAYQSVEPRALALRDDKWLAASKGEPNVLYHGCCVSSQTPMNYSKLPHAFSKKMLRVVEFLTRKQYFLSEVCQQAEGCQRGCDCKQIDVLSTALVMDDHETDQVLDENDSRSYNVRLEYVTYPGPCKCINKNK